MSTCEETAKAGEGEMTGKRKGMEASTDLIQLKLQVCKGCVCVGGPAGEKEQTSQVSWFQRGKETLGVAPQGGASDLTVHLGAVR